MGKDRKSNESKMVSEMISLSKIKDNINKFGDGFAVKVPTQEDHDEMMQIYEVSGKRLKDSSGAPTDFPYPEMYGYNGSLCVSAGKSPRTGSEIWFDDEKNFSNRGWTIYHVKELLGYIGLNSRSQKAMNEWFDLIKPDRASKNLKTVKISEGYHFDIPHYINFSSK
jgi:hypothetical protein